MNVQGEASVHNINGKKQYRGEFYLPESEKYEFLKLRGKLNFEKLECEQKISIEGELKGTTLKAPKVKIVGSANLSRLEADQLKIAFSNKSCYDSIFAKDAVVCPQKENQEFRNEVVAVIEHILKTKLPQQMAKGTTEIDIKFLAGETIDIDSCNVDKIICKDAIIRGSCNIGVLVHENNVKVDNNVHIEEDRVEKYSL